MALDKIHDVPVRELRRVAYGLRGNGGQAEVVDALVGRRRQFHPEAQLGEQGEPQRIVFINVEYAWNAHHAAGSVFQGQGDVMLEQALILVGVKVGQIAA